MDDVFISYARKDSFSFVVQLAGDLKAQSRGVWVDLEDIPPSEKWLAEIFRGIEGAKACVFVLSPGFVASEVCGLELRHAVQNGKRLIPIVRLDVDSKAAPEELSELNWIFLREADDYNENLQRLLKTLDTDPKWVRDHTRFLVRAKEWDDGRRSASFLMWGRELKKAKEWLSFDNERRDPRPTELHREYILASRVRARRRWSVILGLTVAIFLIVGILVVASQNVERLRRSTEEVQKHLVSRQAALSLRSAIKAADLAQGHLLRLATFLRLTTVPQDPLRQALLHCHLVDVLRGHDGRVKSAMFSPNRDDDLILTAGGHSVRLWRRDTGQEVETLRKFARGVKKAVFGGHGQYILAAAGTETFLWKRGATFRDWKPVQTPPSGRQPLLDVASSTCSARKPWVAAAGVEGAWLWQAGATEKVELSSGAVESVTFSPDGELVVTSGDTVEVWATEPTERLATLDNDGASVVSAAISPDRKYVVTAYRNGTAQVWIRDPPNERRRFSKGPTLGGHKGPIQDVLFSPDGKRLATIGNDGTSRLWATEQWQNGARECEVQLKPPGDPSLIKTAAFSPDSRLLATAGQDGVPRVWEVQTGQEFTTFSGHLTEEGERKEFHSKPETIDSIAFSPDGRLVVAAGRDSLARIWSVNSDDGIAYLLRGAGSDVVFSTDGKQLLTSGDSTVTVRNVRTGAIVSVSDAEPKEVTAFALAPDGRSLITGHPDRTMRVWELRDGTWKKTQTLTLEEPDGCLSATSSRDTIRRISFSRDGRLVAATRGCAVYLWSTKGWRYRFRLPPAEKPDSHSELEPPLPSDIEPDDVRDAVFHPKLPLLVSVGDDKIIRVWDTDLGKLGYELGEGPDRLHGAAFSGDGSLLLVAGESTTAQLWDFSAARVVANLGGHDRWVQRVIFSADGRLAVTASQDGTAKVWQVNTGEELARIFTDAGPVLGAAISPNGGFLALSTPKDRTVRVYVREAFAPFETLRQVAHKRTRRLHRRKAAASPGPSDAAGQAAAHGAITGGKFG